MASRPADLMIQCVFDGSSPMCDMDIERRPYHRNCKCALHKVKVKYLHYGSQQRNVAFPKREFRNICSLSVSTSTVSSRSSYVHMSSNRSRDSFYGVQVDSSSRVQCQKSVAK